VLRAQSITVYGLCTCAQPGVWQPEVAAAGTTARTAEHDTRA
jgi:hypothetical protein